MDATSIKMAAPATGEKYTGLRCGMYFLPKSRSVSTDAMMRCSIWLLMVITTRHFSRCLQGFVLALAFPLHPPGKPERSRLAELRSAGTSVLVINGSRDPFGVPGSGDAAKVVVLAGETHALSGSATLITEEVGGWLRRLLGGG